VLSVADASAEVGEIVNLLLDPRFRRTSLKRICALSGTTVADLFTSYKKALFARAHIQATHIIAAKLPPVVKDVMMRAAPQDQPCPVCGGTTTIVEPGLGRPPSPCPNCGATGIVRTEPDLDRQKLALELGHLIEKRGGPLLQQTQNILAASATPGPAGTLESLQQAVGELLFASPRAVMPDATDPHAEPSEAPYLDLPLSDEEPEEREDEEPEAPLEPPAEEGGEDEEEKEEKEEPANETLADAKGRT